MTAHSIAQGFDDAGLGLAGVLHRARQDRVIAQAQADEAQAASNIGAVDRVRRVVAALKNLVVATQVENAALADENASLEAELARANARALKAEGLILALGEARRRAA